MSYRRMKHRDLWEIYRRWRAGQSLARIAAGERRERKTVRRYLRGFAELGLDRDGPGVKRQRFYELVTPLLAGSTPRPAPATDQWLRHRQELRELINRAKDPLKPKSAYLVLKAKYDPGRQLRDVQALCARRGTQPPRAAAHDPHRAAAGLGDPDRLRTRRQRRVAGLSAAAART
jgi:hypothetical protein